MYTKIQLKFKSSTVSLAVALMIILGIASCKDDSTGSDSNTGPVAIASIEPTVATAGDTITIKGSNFSETRPNIVVFSGEESAVKPLGRSNSQLKVIVPQPATTGKITVKLGPENMAVSEQEIKLLPKPFIDSVSPNYGMPGEVIEIFGGKFATEDASGENLSVKFGSTVGVVNSVSPSQLSVSVPEGATSGNPEKLNVKVVRSGISSNAMLFNYETPTQQLITDNFNRDNTDVVTGESSSNPIGGGWKVHKGKWKILDNEIMSRHRNGPGNNFMVHTGTMRPTQPVKSFKFSADVKIETNANSRFGGLVFNVHDEDNYYLLRFNTTVGNTQLLRIENGKFGFSDLLHGEKWPEIENETFYRVTVTSDQPYSFAIKIATTDGQVIGEYNATDKKQAHRDGYVGFFTRVENVVFDNFKYESTVEP